MGVRKKIQLFIVLRWCCFCAAVLAAGFQQAQANQIADIRLLASASISGRFIFLGQISDIEAEDPDMARKLAKVRIDAAPRPGSAMLVPKSTIERRLRRHGLDPAQYRLAAAGPVKVMRRFSQVEPAEIRQAVKQYIDQNAPWDVDQMRVPVIRFNRPVMVPPGPVALKVSAPKHTDWLGAVPFAVRIMVGGQPAKKVTVPVNIEVWSNVVVTARPMGKFQPIDEDTIRVEKRDLAGVPKNAILDPLQVLGCRTNRNIAANSVLRSDQVELPRVVRRGDVVQVVAESPILKIAVKAMAKQNGAVGERIRVVNLRSKKIIYAQVLNEQTVKVDF